MIKYFCDRCNKEVKGLLADNVKLTPEDLYLRKIDGLELCLECRELKDKLENNLSEKHRLERENLNKKFLK